MIGGFRFLKEIEGDHIMIYAGRRSGEQREYSFFPALLIQYDINFDTVPHPRSIYACMWLFVASVAAFGIRGIDI